jgi:hypothetical protein
VITLHELIYEDSFLRGGVVDVGSGASASEMLGLELCDRISETSEMQSSCTRAFTQKRDPHYDILLCKLLSLIFAAGT